MTVNILGISGSPRHANTERLVREALNAARELGNVQTTLISLADYDLRPGTHDRDILRTAEQGVERHSRCRGNMGGSGTCSPDNIDNQRH